MSLHSLDTTQWNSPLNAVYNSAWQAAINARAAGYYNLAQIGIVRNKLIFNPPHPEEKQSFDLKTGMNPGVRYSAENLNFTIQNNNCQYYKLYVEIPTSDSPTSHYYEFVCGKMSKNVFLGGLLQIDYTQHLNNTYNGRIPGLHEIILLDYKEESKWDSVFFNGFPQKTPLLDPLLAEYEKICYSVKGEF